jgi:type II secretory pathway component PulM
MQPGPRERARLAESPWFWALAWFAMAWVAVAVMGPKFDRREQRRERMAEARQQAALRTGRAAERGAERTEAGQGGFDVYVPAPNRVTLLVLHGVCAAGVAVAAIGLARSRRNVRGPHGSAPA